MAKTFKKFREEYDEWGLDEDNSVSAKEERMKNRRDRKRNKRQEKLANFDEKDDKKRK
jgi:hypothetical protein